MKEATNKVQKIIENFYFREVNGRYYLKHMQIGYTCTINGVLIGSGNFILGAIGIVFTIIAGFLLYQNEKRERKKLLELKD